MTYRLLETSHFARWLARFRRAHPELQQRIAQVLSDLAADPWRPELRVHALHGRLAGAYAVRVTQQYRLLVSIDSNSRRITLIDIGSHDKVYR